MVRSEATPRVSNHEALERATMIRPSRKTLSTGDPASWSVTCAEATSSFRTSSSIRHAHSSIGLRYRGPGCLDLVPESRVAGRLNLEPMIVGALPGPNGLGQVVQDQFALCRHDDQDQMADA